MSGKLLKTDSTISVNGGTEVVLAVSIATSFNGFDKDPERESKNEKAIVNARIPLLMQKHITISKIDT